VYRNSKRLGGESQISHPHNKDGHISSIPMSISQLTGGHAIHSAEQRELGVSTSAQVDGHPGGGIH